MYASRSESNDILRLLQNDTTRANALSLQSLSLVKSIYFLCANLLFNSVICLLEVVAIGIHSTASSLTATFAELPYNSPSC